MADANQIMTYHFNFDHRSAVPVLLATALVMTACDALPVSSAEQRSATLTRGLLSTSVSATGYVRPNSEIPLSFPVGGTVAVVHVHLGDYVQPHEVLATLSAAETELALQKARSNLRDAETAVIIAQSEYSRTIDGARPAEIAAAQASLKAANDNYNSVLAGPKEADVRAAKAKLANAEAEVRRAQSNYDNANRQDPAGIGASPAALELEKATNNFNAAKAEYDKVVMSTTASDKSAALRQIADARAQLDKLRQPAHTYDIAKAQADIEQALDRVEQTKVDVAQVQLKLDQFKLVAPTVGIVSNVVLKSGQFIGVEPVVTLIDVSQLYADVNLDEADITRIVIGQPAIIRLDALPGVDISGTVKEIAPVGRIVNGTVSFLVRVALSKPSELVRPGMTANAHFILAQRVNVLLAPVWAIRNDAKTGRNFLTIPNANATDKTSSTKTHEIEITLGLKDDALAEIVSGATEGQIVLQPTLQANTTSP